MLPVTITSTVEPSRTEACRRLRQGAEEGTCLAAAFQRHYIARTGVEGLEYAGSGRSSERPDPADELGVDSVIHADVGTQLTTEAEPPLENAPQAAPRREIEEHNLVGSGEPCRQDTELHPVDHPSLAANHRVVDGSPLLGSWLDLTDSGHVPPVEPIDMQNRQTQTLAQLVCQVVLPAPPQPITATRCTNAMLRLAPKPIPNTRSSAAAMAAALALGGVARPE